MVARLLPALSVASVSAAFGVPVYCLLFLPCLLPAGLFLPLLCCPCACCTWAPSCLLAFLVLMFSLAPPVTRAGCAFLSSAPACLVRLQKHDLPPPTLPCSHTCKKTWQKTSENAPDKHKHTTSNHHRARHNPAANPLSNKPKTPTNLNPARDKHITPAGVLLAPWRYTRSQRNPASPQRRTRRRRRYPRNHRQ